MWLFRGFTKSRLLIRWLDSNTNTVKHACAICFDEQNSPISSTDQPSPCSILLRDASSFIIIPHLDTEIDITDSPHLDSAIFSLTINLTPLGHYL